MNKKIRSWWQKAFAGSPPEFGQVIERKQHALSRKNISPNALKVMYRLNKKGFQAYLVGGGVRDVLLDRTTKDFDIATDAHPEQICKLFANSRLIGRRFRLVHVFFKGEIIEVATFRAGAEAESMQKSKEDSANVYGTLEEDAWRRDFTVNALYYGVNDFSILDFTGGMQDIQKKQLRIIGDAKQRFHEDPARLLRAVRFAAKLKFRMHSDTHAAVLSLRHLLQELPESRLFYEWTRLFFEGQAWLTYKKLVEYDYLPFMLPQHVVQDVQGKYAELVRLSLEETDQRFSVGKSLNPGFLLSVLLWGSLQEELAKSESKYFYRVLHRSIEKILQQQKDVLVVPKRLIVMVKNVWLLQYYLQRRRPARIRMNLSHRYFRAAFDLLSLRAKTGEVPASTVTWWQKIQEADTKKRAKMIAELESE